VAKETIKVISSKISQILTIALVENLKQLKKNPKWERDELILALDLYLKYRFSTPRSTAIKELSDLLNSLGSVLGLRTDATYRNENGVSMKLMNFRRFDPEYKKAGVVGLARGNKDEEVVWNDLANDPERLQKVVAAIKNAISNSHPRQLNFEEPEIYEAQEGKILTRLHRIRERDAAIVRKCKQTALDRHGKLSCEACGFDFTQTYGEVGAGIIDVHHRQPLHTLGENSRTKISDLALVCANCHRIIHSSRNWLSVDQVKDAIEKSKLK